MTTTTTTKQDASPSAPLPPLPPLPSRSSQEDRTPSDDKCRVELAAGKNTSVFDAFLGDSSASDSKSQQPVSTDENLIKALEKAEPCPSEPVASPNHDLNTIPEFGSDSVFDAFLAEKKQKGKSVSTLTTALLEQNKFLIQQLAEQTKFTIDRLIIPPPVICAACGAAEGQASDGSKKKVKKETKEERNSKSWAPEKFVPWSISRVVTLGLLVVIVMQLSFFRGEIAERSRKEDRDGMSGRKMGFFGW